MATTFKTLLSLHQYLTLLLFLCFLQTNYAQNVSCPQLCSCLGSFVDCSRSKLDHIPHLPVWVEILELQNNKIAHISKDTFKGLKLLKEINLSHNILTNVSIEQFAHVPGLQQLKIQHNKLTSVPEIGMMANLKFLSLNHNEIRSISSQTLLNYPNLETLDLNNNKISYLAANTFHNNSKITHLALSNNKMVRLEKKCFDNLTSLESLKLSKNRLNELPADLFINLKNLRLLDLNRNNLTFIEGLAFKGLSSLHVLKLKKNGMVSLRDGAFYGLEKIRILSLDYNNLTVVKEGWLYGLKTVAHMSLSHNHVSEIESNAWIMCDKLNELDLTHNKLTTIRKGIFDNLQSLRYLYLDNNTISYIEYQALMNLVALEVLEMNNNAISWSIEDSNGAFVGLDRLNRLGLHSNRIRSIANRAFVGLGRLRELDLSNNPVTSVQENAFEVVPFLQTLRLNTTNLLCDCKLSWLPKWLIQTAFQHSVNTKCGYPEPLKDKSIFSLSPKDFTCDDHPKPYMTEEPTTQVTLKGDNVTIVCRAESSSNSPITYQWRKGYMLLMDAQVENFAKTKEGDITEYTTILKLPNIQDQDEGSYQCIISNHFGSTYSKKAQITVHVFPVFSKVPVDIAVKAGSKATLDCKATGSPPPEIAWQKDGGNDFPAARERRMHVIPKDDRFFIVEVKDSDMGVYSCTATNVVGTIVANVTLTVLETPSFLKPMEDKKVKVSETAVLECMASGRPTPELRWLKDGQVIGPTEKRFFTAGNQLLVIVEATEEDSGTYTCEMSNTLGTHKDSVSLSVMSTNSEASSSRDSSMTTGIIIIAVVCCVVGTSIVWVIIIYQSRKRHMEYNSSQTNDDAGQAHEMTPFPGPFHPVPAAFCGITEEYKTNQIYFDSNSETSSKDSGTGDSTKRSDDNLVLNDGKSGVNRHSVAFSDKQYGVEAVGPWPPCGRAKSVDQLVYAEPISMQRPPKPNLVPEQPSSHQNNHFSTFPRKKHVVQSNKEKKNDDSRASFASVYSDHINPILHEEYVPYPDAGSSNTPSSWQPGPVPPHQYNNASIPCTVSPYKIDAKKLYQPSAVS